MLAYPPHLVREYLERFGLNSSSRVLDPFCGTGTTLVECKKLGIQSIGVEANSVASFASKVKTEWTVDPDDLLDHARQIAQHALTQLENDGIGDIPMALRVPDENLVLLTLPPEKMKLLLGNSISPLPLHKALVLLESLDKFYNPHFYAHERLAFANVVVQKASNLHFGPEVGVGSIKSDEAVINPWMAAIREMVADLRDYGHLQPTPANVYTLDARELVRVVEPESVDAVITSPPYPNEKDYTRTTRLESVLLGFINSKGDLQALKRSLIRSNTRGVYVGDSDDQWIANFPRIQQLADDIEARRLALGKTSGFERQYARVTKLYFGGMARHFAELRHILRPGAQLAYVVGDQASYLRVMIRTSEILGEIAASLGYEVMGTDLFRTRFSTASREYMREDVLLLRWTGRKDGADN